MKSIVICGKDPTLLQVRAEVLRRASFVPILLLGIDAFLDATLEEDPALLVLCNSLPLAERVRANALAKTRFPSVPVITLLRGLESDNHLLGETLTLTEGPAALVSTAHRLTRFAQAACSAQIVGSARAHWVADGV
ncbi:hypothetical protein Terro_3148 [Terriglobus roseus DSM 18391]|uniref:Response regulatory domain-containing protein n=1 Tax=Terriglobus roseus (strain DSM 18391 / NRRL B-41598 / KBS 63) TaxID=926566 RepID=I3ZJF9_TERRK|nr:hypothetical protein Terro_3148 [Terriglobus roseus DSM 18391]